MAVVKSADRVLWETCLTSRIQRRIDDLTREHADLFDEVRHRAREQAVAELGLTELEAAERQLRDERFTLERRQRELERAQLAALRNCAAEEVPDADLALTRSSVALAINARIELCEPPFLAESSAGRQLLELEEERERLLETVLLANSAEQLQTLWQRLSERLDEPATPLQKFVLGQPATEDASAAGVSAQGVVANNNG